MMMPPSPDATALADALAEDDPAAVAALLDPGADVRYRRDDGYDALIDALHGHYLLRDGRLLDLLRPLCDESRAAFVLGVERPRWRRAADGTP
jgi:hypothetical protein